MKALKCNSPNTLSDTTIVGFVHESASFPVLRQYSVPPFEDTNVCGYHVAFEVLLSCNNKSFRKYSSTRTCALIRFISIYFVHSANIDMLSMHVWPDENTARPCTEYSLPHTETHEIIIACVLNLS